MASKGDPAIYYVDRGSGLVGSPAIITGPGRDDPSLDGLFVFWAAGAGNPGFAVLEAAHAGTPTEGCWTEPPAAS